jgi:hypothetical protein
VDGVVVEPEGDDVLGLHPAARLSLTAVVSLRAGTHRGPHALALRSAYPSGAPGPGLERTIEFTDAHPGASLVVPLDLQIHESGIYTFDAFFDDRLLTRMSLWVAYAHG